MSVGLPAEARAERDAILASYGMGTVVKSPLAIPPEGAEMIVRAVSCEAASAIDAWSAKWNVEQYGFLRRFKSECSDAGHFNYYHLTVPEFVDEPDQ